MPLNLESLERIVPKEVDPSSAIQTESLALHLARYRFAEQHLSPGRVLDIACGVGYGTALLAASDKTKAAVGVDCCADTLDYARKHYSAENVSYVLSDALMFGDEQGFDSIVSLETVEHMHNPEAFLVHLKSLLRPGGTIVASVPITPSTDGNPFHLHDFTKGSFRALASHVGLRTAEAFEQVQPFRMSGLKRESRLSGMRKNLFGYYCCHPAALARRISSFVVDGLNNRYLTLVLRNPDF